MCSVVMTTKQGRRDNQLHSVELEGVSTSEGQFMLLCHTVHQLDLRRKHKLTRLFPTTSCSLRKWFGRFDC